MKTGMKRRTNGMAGAVLFAATLGIAMPAAAEMYKWVDENGVVTYSNTPPTTKQPKKVEAVAERVSVYTPDAQLNQAMQSESRGDRKKVASLEKELEAERRARARAEQSARKEQDKRAAAYERCVAARGVDCEAVRNGTASTMAYTEPYGATPLPFVPVGVRTFPPKPFAVLSTPNSTIGINPAPPVGISTAPPVGAQPPRNIRSNPPR